MTGKRTYEACSLECANRVSGDYRLVVVVAARVKVAVECKGALDLW
jgi:hypothetical protein